MKKHLFLLGLLCLSLTSYGQNIDFPDANFKAALLTHTNPVVDTNNDEEISTLEAMAITSLDLSNKQISDLTGIEYFPNLLILKCNKNQLSDLDITQNTTLENLICDQNQLRSLDVTKNKSLKALVCKKNGLRELNVSQNILLEKLECDQNAIASLNISQNNNLIYLNCGVNMLTTLDVSSNFNLKDIFCGGNNLNELDVSQNINLQRLFCSATLLKTLDISQNIGLIRLSCGSNQLTSLDLTKNINLSQLNCSANLLTSLDLTKNPNLRILRCSNNELTTLDVTQNKNLQRLSCEGNNFMKLDLSNNSLIEELLIGQENLTHINMKNGDNYFEELINCEVKSNGIGRFNLSRSPNLEYICIDEEELFCVQLELERNGYINTSIVTDCILPAACLETVAIPDTNFEQALLDLNIDTDGILNGVICKEDALAIISLDVRNSNISDLTGIEAFANVTALRINDNKLTSLDLRQNEALISLTAYRNELTSLNLSKNTALQAVTLGVNQLTTLDISNCTNLLKFSASRNRLSSFVTGATNTKLTGLDLSNNQFATLDLSNASGLEVLNVRGNVLLTSLNIKNENNIKLRAFKANRNIKLNCIEVDDVAFANAQPEPINTSSSAPGWQKDATATYSTTCPSVGAKNAENITTTNDIIVYPTVVNDGKLFINTVGQISGLSIYNIQGQAVYSSPNAVKEIAVNHLRSGLYLVRILKEGSNLTTKILIK